MSESTLRTRLAEVEQADYGDTWMREHKGELTGIEGRVWKCGDDCGCTEASVVAVFRNRGKNVYVPAFVNIALWVGDFFTDYEQGADEQLAELRRSLRESDPEMETRIVWSAVVR